MECCLDLDLQFCSFPSHCLWSSRKFKINRYLTWWAAAFSIACWWFQEVKVRPGSWLGNEWFGSLWTLRHYVESSALFCSQGLNLMTSVAQPVFDTRNYTVRMLIILSLDPTGYPPFNVMLCFLQGDLSPLGSSFVRKPYSVFQAAAMLSISVYIKFMYTVYTAGEQWQPTWCDGHRCASQGVD